MMSRLEEERGILEIATVCDKVGGGDNMKWGNTHFSNEYITLKRLIQLMCQVK